MVSNQVHVRVCVVREDSCQRLLFFFLTEVVTERSPITVECRTGHKEELGQSRVYRMAASEGGR